MEIIYFRWDEDILSQIARQGIKPDEIEEIAFEDYPYIRRGKRGRRYLYGQTMGGRFLFVVYVLSSEKIAQVITAREMDEKERKLYLRRGK